MTTRQIESLGPDSLPPSQGLVSLKQVEVVDGQERTVRLLLPITTAGVQEAIQLLVQADPQPPVRDKLVLPNSDLGRSLGLTEKKVVGIADEANAEYRERKRAYEERLQWGLAAVGVAVPLRVRRDDGTLAEPEGLDERIEALKQSGLKFAHVVEINKALQRLLSWTQEERKRFFGETSE
jgi:hypothetical protein